MKKLKKALAGLTIAGAVTLGMTIPVLAAAPANAGPIVCHTVATKHNPPASCWFTPSNPSTGCQPYYTYKRVCD